MREGGLPLWPYFQVLRWHAAQGPTWLPRQTNGILAQISGEDAMIGILQLNVALAAAGTAYQSWKTDEDFDTYIERLRTCLAVAGAGAASPAP
ncbi:hypothetical protein [Streptomyces maremycinicus]|uniref:hypothetical protein n=1 Tax=Streptomyces maremycinicus TaxID=1679753 RepID=UPI000788C679|nr:hypothetical protein [Streptomyces sp. NBRC 110468]